MTRCIICGKVIEDDNYSICGSCITRNITLDNALSIGKEWTEEIEINGFLVSYFKDFVDELEDLLIEAIKSKYEKEPEVVNKSLKEYFDYDSDCFIRHLEEKWNVGK